MTQATTKDYWISPSALHIELNALGNPDYIQASCVSGAQILVYVKDIIGYDAGHNYRRWPLQAAPTVFNTHTEKYVYAAIPRDMTLTASAWIVFPSEPLDIYGKNEKEDQIGDGKYYYIYLQGIITSSGDNGTTQRDWKQRISTGFLSSDEAISAIGSDTEWYHYSSTDGIVTFLKNITMKAGTKFRQLFAKTITVLSGGKIVFENQGEVNGVASDSTPLETVDKIVTPNYLDSKALSKIHNDTAQGIIRFMQGLKLGDGENYVDGYGIDSLGNAKLHEIIINAIKSVGFEKTLQGFGVWIDDDGKAHGQIDFIEVVGKAIFHELEIRRLSSVGGDISLSPASSRIERVEKVANGWKCYIKTDDGTTATYNGWKPGDQPRCQTFNIREGVYSGISNRYYWRTVEEVAEKTAEHDAYIILSNVANFYDPNGTDEPMAGDVIVLCGHNALWDKVHGVASSDRSRMNYTQLTTSGNSPTIEMYRNIYDFSLGTKNIVLKLSSEKITLRSSAVEWMSYSGDIVPNVIHMGKWPAQGTTAHKYESWQCDGATWLCIAESTKDRPGKNSPAWSALAEKGQKGDTGLPGPAGTSVSVQSTSITYQASASGTIVPTGAWLTAIPTVAPGQYLWTKTYVLYSDNKNTTTYSVALQGATGKDGVQGAKGADGTSVTIKSTSVTYAVTSNAQQPAVSAFTSTTVPTLAVGQYLWTRTYVLYSDGKSTESYSVSRIGTDGAQGAPGTKGVDGKSTFVHFAYANSVDGSQGFSVTPFANALYIGTRTDNTEADSTRYSDYKWSRLKGDQGDTGLPGPAGTSVSVQSTSITYQASASGTIVPTGVWLTAIPTVAPGQYLWTKTYVLYSDNKNTTTYSVALQGATGQQGIPGKNGLDGDDAYQIITNPSTIVFDTDNKGLVTPASLAANKATVLINKGGVDTVPTSVEIYTAHNKFCAASVSGNIISVTSVDKNATTNYSEGYGYVGIKAALDGRTFYAKIPFAVNLHAVTASLKTGQDNVTASVQSLTKTVNGNKKAVDTRLSVMDGNIDLAIKKTVGGTNLLKGASLRWDSVTLTESYTQQVVEQRQSANASVRRYSGTSDAAHNGHAFVKVELQNNTTPQYEGVFFKTYVEKDKEYTASAWVNSSKPDETVLELFISDALEKNKNLVWCGKRRLCDNDVGKWKYIKETFTAPKSGWLRVYVWQGKNGTLYISEVQLEEGNTATSWHDPDVDEQFAALNLKADNIKLGLVNAGIDIKKGIVSVIADKFRVKSANGTPIAVFKLGVNGNPILQAPYIDVDNLTVKKIEGAIGTFKEIYSSEGAMPNHPELAMTMRLTNNIIMFDSKDIKARFGLGTLPATSGFPDIPLCLDVKNDRGGAIGAYISAMSNAPVYDLDPSIEGSHALYIQNGNISGFRLYSKRSRGSMTLSKMDNVIVDLNEAGDSTYTLPSGCEDGQFYMIFSTSEEISIKTSGIDRFSYRDRSTTMDVDPWDLTFLVYDARNHKWNMRFARQT